MRSTLPADVAPTAAKLAAFATIGGGGIGLVSAPALLADRLGRTTLTIAAMAICGTCAATIGFLFGGRPGIAGRACALVWGVSIVADSAQFSASIAELADRDRVGTMLTRADRARIHADARDDPPDALPDRRARLALRVHAAGDRTGSSASWAMARLRAHPRPAALAGGRR